MARAPERHSSPTHDLPTYSQATSSTERVTTPPADDHLTSPSSRQRALSDPSSLRAVPTRLPEIPTLQYKPTLETVESVPGISEAEPSSERTTGDDRAPEKIQSHDSVPKSGDSGTGSRQEVVVTVSMDPQAEMPKQEAPKQKAVSHDQEIQSHDQGAESHDQNNVEEQPNESSDFARNVRCGTSTPIDESPKIGGGTSRTFDSDYDAGETVDTADIELTIDTEAKMESDTGC